MIGSILALLGVALWLCAMGIRAAGPFAEPGDELSPVSEVQVTVARSSGEH